MRLIWTVKWFAQSPALTVLGPIYSWPTVFFFFFSFVTGQLYLAFNHQMPFFSFFIFSGRIIKILSWFLLYINMDQAWVYMSPPSWTSFPTSLGCPRAPVWAVSHTANSHWRSILHGSSHATFRFFPTLPPPLSPQICSLVCVSTGALQTASSAPFF